jgi:hypothetical protein
VSTGDSLALQLRKPRRAVLSGSRPRRRSATLIVARGYDHDKYRWLVWQHGVKPLTARRQTEHGYDVTTVTVPGRGYRRHERQAPAPPRNGRNLDWRWVPECQRPGISMTSGSDGTRRFGVRAVSRRRCWRCSQRQRRPCITGASRGRDLAAFYGAMNQLRSPWLSQIQRAGRRIRLRGLLTENPALCRVFPFLSVCSLGDACITRASRDSSSSAGKGPKATASSA